LSRVFLKRFKLSAPEREMDEKECIERIRKDLAQSGLRSGIPVMVHSSLKSLGSMPGGPETLVRGLLSALGPEGTLLMPALSYAYVSRENPLFDVLNTPSNVGYVTEFFRKRAGTRRSVNPTHSVCGTGAETETILSGHHVDDTPCGPNSPWRRLCESRGQILMLGCGLEPNTSMHGIEELVEPEYLFGDHVNYTILHEHGEKSFKICRSHNFKGWEQRYDRVSGVLDKKGMRSGAVLSAGVQIIEAAVLWERAEKALRRDPLFFVDRVK
jgi:aminoglycoside 3-N-acetyltransferase